MSASTEALSNNHTSTKNNVAASEVSVRKPISPELPHGDADVKATSKNMESSKSTRYTELLKSSACNTNNN